MMSSTRLQLWFEANPMTYSKEEDLGIRNLFAIPLNHHILIPQSFDRPHLPFLGYTSFFYDQLVAGFHFPLFLLAEEVLAYFRIPLNKLTPNTIRLLYGVSVE